MTKLADPCATSKLFAWAMILAVALNRDFRLAL
jgi:hypothetical protein